MNRIRVSALSLAALAGVTASAPAAAQEGGGGFTVGGGATIVSDYRFRGISQSDRRPALQGSLSVSHASGLYGTVWGSTIDDYVANGADTELDFILGYSRTFGGTTIDAGIVYYHYPNTDGGKFDFVEPFVSLSHVIGPVTAKATAAYAPKQDVLSVGAGEEDNLYLAGDLTLAIPSTPVSLTAHLGRSWGPSYITLGDAYTDWSLGASATQGSLTFGLSYVDTDADLVLPSGRNASGSGIVASVGVSF